jgi:hypothetical protein
MEITCKAAVGDTVYYISDKGKIMSNPVELITIVVGSSTYSRTDHWVGTSKSSNPAVITYKLANTPASYILNEAAIYLTKEELLGNI